MINNLVKNIFEYYNNFDYKGLVKKQNVLDKHNERSETSICVITTFYPRKDIVETTNKLITDDYYNFIDKPTSEVEYWIYNNENKYKLHGFLTQLTISSGKTMTNQTANTELSNIALMLENDIRKNTMQINTTENTQYINCYNTIETGYYITNKTGILVTTINIFGLFINK